MLQTNDKTQNAAQSTDGGILSGGDSGNDAGLLDGAQDQQQTQTDSKQSFQDVGNNQQASGGVADGLAPLPDNATDVQRAEFEKKLRALSGVPQDANSYGNFGFGDDVKIDTNSEDYKYYTKLFHDVGISKTQAKKLLEAHAKYASGQVEHAQRQSDEKIREYRDQVKRDFIKSVGGDAQFKEYQDTAVRGFKASAQGASLTQQEITGLLNVMSDDPRFIKIFHSIGKMFREDVLITGSAPRAQEKTFDDMFKDMFNK